MFALPSLASSGPGTAETFDIVAFLEDADSRTVIEQLAQLHAGPGKALVQKGGVREAILCLERLVNPPKLLVVDVSGLDMPVSEVDALAETCEPSICVVVVGDRDEVGLFRGLIRLGVADYLVKPLSVDLLRHHVGEDATGLDAPASRAGKLVVATGARGGVGTTTIAANLGWFLANHRKRRTAMIDLDFHGGVLSTQLGLAAGGLAEVLATSRRLDPLIVERTLLSQGPRLTLLSGETALDQKVPIEAEALADLIELLERQYHYVIVDLPRRPGAAYGYLLKRASVRILVANRTVPAARTLARMLELTEGAAGRTLLILNEDRPLSAGLVRRDMLEEILGRSFDLEIPYAKEAPLVGDNLGEPLVARTNGFTQAIATLVANLVGERPPPSSLWRKLFRA